MADSPHVDLRSCQSPRPPRAPGTTVSSPVRPTLAALGIFAARKLDRADVAEELGKVLDAEPLGALTRKNPSLSPFLDT